MNDIKNVNNLRKIFASIYGFTCLGLAGYFASVSENELASLAIFLFGVAQFALGFYWHSADGYVFYDRVIIKKLISVTVILVVISLCYFAISHHITEADEFQKILYSLSNIISLLNIIAPLFRSGYGTLVFPQRDGLLRVFFILINILVTLAFLYAYSTFLLVSVVGIFAYLLVILIVWYFIVVL